MRDAVQDGLDGVAQRGGVLQQQPFEMLADGAQAVAEVGLQEGLASCAAEVLLGVVAEQPRHGDQAAACPQLLAHPALALRVEGLQPHQALDDLVQLFDAPAGVIEVGEGWHRIVLAVQQRGHQGVLGAAGRVLDQSRAHGPQGGLRLLAAGVVTGPDGDELVSALAAHEVGDEGAGVGLQAEEGVQAAQHVVVQQQEGVVAAVVDDDSAGAQGGQVGQRGGALVGVGGQVDVDGQAGAQLVQAAEQALRVVGAGGGSAVAVVAQRAGQVQLGAVDGEDGVAAPQPAGSVGRRARENRVVDVPEGLVADLGPGVADRGDRHGPGAGQGQLQLPALLPHLLQRGGVGHSTRSVVPQPIFELVSTIK